MAVHLQRQRHRFTVAEYHRMGEAGILRAGDRVELLDGEIVEMTPIDPPHAGITDNLARVFIVRLAERAHVRIQNPIVLGEHSEPQPDLALLAPKPHRYFTEHPTTDEVFLVIEVCDSTLADDRKDKLPIYAQAAIREVWLVDVNARRIEVYQQPSPQGYQLTRLVGRDERISPLAFPELELVVAELIG